MITLVFSACSDNLGPSRNQLTAYKADGLFYGVITDSNNNVLHNCYLALSQDGNILAAAFRYSTEEVAQEAHGGGGFNNNQIALNLQRPDKENFIITGQINISEINQGVSIVGNITWPNNGNSYNLTVNRIGGLPKKE